MSLPPPIFSSSVDSRLTEYIRALNSELSSLSSIVRDMKNHPLMNLSSSDIQTLTQSPSSTTYNDPQQQFGLGQLSQGQFTYAPILTTLPDLGDPLSQNGQIIFIENPIGTYTQYEFDGRTSPGTWVLAPTINSGVYVVKDIDITPVSVNANVTTNQTLMTYSISAGFLNTLNKTLRITCYGNLDELNGPNITFTLAIVNGASVTGLAAWTPNTPGVTKTNLPWKLSALITTQTTGASGALEVHGEVSVDPATAAGTVSQAIQDHNTGTIAAVDLTLAYTLKILIAFSVASASNVGRQRMMLIESLN